MSIGEIAFADLFMIVGYLVLMLGIGGYFYRRMKNMKDFFSGGNTIPWWLSGVSFYMSSFSVAAFTMYPSLCFQHGWVGVTMLWVAVPATIFSVQIFAIRWRRARIDSPVEYLENRYSPLLRQIFAWQGVPVRIIDDGIKLMATAMFISVCMELDLWKSVVAIGIIILLYTFMGGLWAVAITDFIQFVVLTAALLIIFPLSIIKAGGFSGIAEGTPDGFFKMTSPEYGWGYIIPLVLLYAFAWSSTQWSLIQRYYCVPTERDALKVGWFVAALYVIGPPLMFFPAIAGTQFLGEVDDTGKVFALLCVNLLPKGMLGLAVAAMFAATMSSLSSDYNVCASVLTNDVYKRLFNRNASDKHLVWIGRIMTLVVGLIALATGLVIASLNDAEDLFGLMVKLFGIATSPVAVPMMVGLLWRKMGNTSAIIGCLSGILAGIFLFVLSYDKTQAASLLGIQWQPEGGKIIFWGLAMKSSIAMFFGTTIVTSGAMFISHLLIPTRQEEQARIDAFMDRLNAPIGEMDGEVEAAATVDTAGPFKVVGVSILLIGVLMMCVLPWVGGGSVFMLDLLVGAVLIIGGGLVAWLCGRQADKATE